MVTLQEIIALPLIAALASYLVIPMVRKFCVKYNIVAVPGGRHKHKNVVPLGGGIAIALGFLLTLLLSGDFTLQKIGLIIGVVLMAGLGLADDKFELPPIIKFVGQASAAIIVILFGIKIDTIGFGGDNLYQLGALSGPLTVVWIVGLINAINFIDGMDGLASGLSGISAVILGVVSAISGQIDLALLNFCLAMAIFVFIPFNYSSDYKKKIFMGDSGSGMIGFSLAALSIMGSVKTAATFSVLVPIIILIVPIFDMIAVIIKRIMMGKSPFEGDRLHLHYQLIDLGADSRQTIMTLCALTAFSGLVAIALTVLDCSNLIIILSIAIIILALLLWRIRMIKTITKRR